MAVMNPPEKKLEELHLCAVVASAALGRVIWLWRMRHAHGTPDTKQTLYIVPKNYFQGLFIVPSNFQGLYKVHKNYFQEVYKVTKNYF